jgi:type I restriction enzyme S subunit
MEVKPGYKKTEVGVIPEEWELTPFITLGSVIDGDRGTNYPSGTDFSSDGHCLFLNAGNVTKVGFRFSDCAFISREKDERLSKGKLKRDDIVLTTRGTVGNFAHFDSAVAFEHVRINSGMVILRNESAELDNAFLYALLQSHFVEKQIERLTFGSAQPQLTVKGINEFWIVAPPLPEQRAIATALSDVDGLLGGLDRLIAKKRDLKQAAMQQLLTCQTRLPGFHGEWSVVELKSLYARVFKKSPLSSGDGRSLGAYPLFVSGGEAKRTDLALFQNTEALIISDGGVFDVRYFSGDFSVTDHCFVISLKGDMRFYYQWMSLLKAELDLMTFKGSGLRNLDKPTFGKVEVPLPPPAEQNAIAEVLTEMDGELAVLEQRREKTRALKQAMMQELLTGRTRLI